MTNVRSTNKNKGFAPRTPQKDENDESGGCHPGKSLVYQSMVFLPCDFTVARGPACQRTPTGVGGGGRRGGRGRGQNLKSTPPKENSFQPPHLGTLCPPPISFWESSDSKSECCNSNRAIPRSLQALIGCDSDGDSESISCALLYCDSTQFCPSRREISGDCWPAILGIMRFAIHRLPGHAAGMLGDSGDQTNVPSFVCATSFSGKSKWG